MKTRLIDEKRGSVYDTYFSDVTRHTKSLRNTANFLIRNTMTGIRKSPEERTHNETEVLHLVFTGIHTANENSDMRFHAAFEKASKPGLSAMEREKIIHTALKRHAILPYPTPEKWMLSYGQLDAILKLVKDRDYYALPAQVNQQAVRKTCSSWKAYFNALADWKKHPQKYKEMPRIPRYIREGHSTAHFTNQVLKPELRDGKVMLSFPCGGPVLCVGDGIKASRIVKAEVKPYCGGYRILVTYDSENKVPAIPEHPGRILGIDLGMDNLFACAGNYGGKPFLIDGRWLKSMNRQFNKERARLISCLTAGKDSPHSRKHSKRLDTLSRKRDAVIRDFFYKAAHSIVRDCLTENVEAIVIGCNKDIKQGADMGSHNNQNFISIPHMRAAQILKAVAAESGIPVILQEESYTSKASFLDMDQIPDYGNEKGEPVFSGKRVKRGLYCSKDGRLINADINGALNIIRKEYPDAFTGINDLSYLIGAVERITRDKLCRVKPDKKEHSANRRKMSDARKINRREHRYKKRMYEELFTGTSAKKRIEVKKAAAIEANKAKALKKAA